MVAVADNAPNDANINADEPKKGRNGAAKKKRKKRVTYNDVRYQPGVKIPLAQDMCAPGASFNPHPEQHQEALRKAYASLFMFQSTCTSFCFFIRMFCV